MILIENADDFEMYSANSAGGIQGHGYQCRNAGYVSFFFRVHSSLIVSTQPSAHSYCELQQLVDPRLDPRGLSRVPSHSSRGIQRRSV